PIRVRLATHRAAGGARRLRLDRARAVPHAHPGALSAGSADLAGLYVLRGRRQLDHEPRASQVRVLEPDFSSDFGHHALADREAEAGALVGALRGEKRIEDAAPDLSWDARSRVVHRQSDPSLAGLGAELDDRRLTGPHHLPGVGL